MGAGRSRVALRRIYSNLRRLSHCGKSARGGEIVSTFAHPHDLRVFLIGTCSKAIRHRHSCRIGPPCVALSSLSFVWPAIILQSVDEWHEVCHWSGQPFFGPLKKSESTQYLEGRTHEYSAGHQFTGAPREARRFYHHRASRRDCHHHHSGGAAAPGHSSGPRGCPIDAMPQQPAATGIGHQPVSRR